jgi:hypothetical protein
MDNSLKTYINLLEIQASSQLKEQRTEGPVIMYVFMLSWYMRISFPKSFKILWLQILIDICKFYIYIYIYIYIRQILIIYYLLSISVLRIMSGIHRGRARPGWHQSPTQKISGQVYTLVHGQRRRVARWPCPSWTVRWSPHYYGKILQAACS